MNMYRHRRGLTAVMSLTLAFVAGCAGPPAGTVTDAASSSGSPVAWPPALAQSYPDLQVISAEGKRMKLSELKGKTVLVEPIGMSCAACQAFAGAHEPGVGAFSGVAPQPGMPSAAEAVQTYAGIEITDPRLVYVQLLLYDMSGSKTPTARDLEQWAEHFAAEAAPNRLLVIPVESMVGPASYNLIPGFQLIDKDFILRFDSTGHSPHHNLWNDLLPALGRMVKSSV